MLKFLTRPTTAAAAVLLVFVLLLAAFAVGVWAVLAGGKGIGLLLMTFVPLPFYLWAVWIARRAILLIGQGGAMHSIVATMVHRVGAALFIGGLVRVAIVPIAIRLVSGAGSYAVFDPAAITVGVVGVTLMIVSRVVAEADAMRSELDEII